MTSYYNSSITNFLNTSTEEIIGKLSTSQSRDVHTTTETMQTISWMHQIEILKSTLSNLQLENNDGILFEYFIPRRSKRIDVVILTKNIIFVLEFKSRTTTRISSFRRNDIEQCEDYALDIRDFHKESRNRIIVPVLIDTSVDKSLQTSKSIDQVKEMVAVNNSKSLEENILKMIQWYGSKHEIELEKWDKSVYEPTPTIIEAAQSLYANHNVRDITTSGADRYNLDKTTSAVLNAVDFAMENKRKVIVFVTGVPGSGKTLVGLNIAHDETIRSKGYNASFLSGNGPLVIVLQEALARDKKERENIPLYKALRDSKTKVQSVLGFKRHYHQESVHLPDEHIIIFDEAQRAWNKDQMESKSRNDAYPFTTSEPELMISIMERHKEWVVIICLIGTGQEIHTGEAGLSEWGKTIESKYRDWVIFTSPEALCNPLKSSNQSLFESIPNDIDIRKDPSLHLRTTIRSYKATKLSDWVYYVLNNDIENAVKLSSELKDYPIVITRNLQKAKNWLKKNCRGTRSSGIVCSSGAKRLRPLGIELHDSRSRSFDVAKWFLSEKTDVRSSSFLELPATEFDIQGLERDWICLAWDLDLTRNENGWVFRDFVGTQWKNIRNETKKEYLLNSYRVLLTRGREGLV
ncbi:MAG: DUF2075 domain-containing protein, partial [Asgard group archaeon]|nr:DUF2075 domain-containing protein [Asgard group archaeon]